MIQVSGSAGGKRSTLPTTGKGDGATVSTPGRVTDDEGGESACWLSLVCPECGHVTENGSAPCRCDPSLAVGRHH